MGHSMWFQNSDSFQFCLNPKNIFFGFSCGSNSNWTNSCRIELSLTFLRLLISSRLYPNISLAHLIFDFLICLNKYLFPQHAVLISALISLSTFPKVATCTCLSKLDSPSGTCIFNTLLYPCLGLRYCLNNNNQFLMF